MTRRSDTNQPTIVEELRQAGCIVTDLHEVGHGCPDIVVSHCGARPAGQNWLFEVKTKGGELTDDEIEWHRRWPGQKAVIYDSLDALRIMGVLG